MKRIAERRQETAVPSGSLFLGEAGVDGDAPFYAVVADDVKAVDGAPFH